MKGPAGRSRCVGGDPRGHANLVSPMLSCLPLVEARVIAILKRKYGRSLQVAFGDERSLLHSKEFI